MMMVQLAEQIAAGDLVAIVSVAVALYVALRDAVTMIRKIKGGKL